MSPPWQDIRDVLTSRGYQPLISGKPDQYRGRVDVGGVSVEIEITISDLAFVTMPTVRILNLEDLPKPVWGHLSDGNQLCYANRASLLLDMYQPGASVLAVLEQVRKTLEVLLHGNPTPEILAELQAYWGGSAYAFIDDPFALDKTTLAKAEFSPGHFLYVAGRDKKRLEAWAEKARAKVADFETISVLQCRGPVFPPSKPPATLQDAISWAVAQPEISSNVEQIAAINPDAPPALFLVGDNAILGFKTKPDAVVSSSRKKGFRPGKLAELCLKRKSTLAIEPIRGLRADHAEITARNIDGPAPLSQLKLVLIGCGTLGSYLAKGLVQCGAGQEHTILMADPDLLSAGNLGRHLLGIRHLGVNKAQALKSELEMSFPDVLIDVVPDDARSCLSRMARCDLVIDATGSEQFSNALNAHALKSAMDQEAFPPVLYAMIFGNGVAVQTFLATGKPDAACYRCLRPVYGKDWRYSPLKSRDYDARFAVRPCSEGTFIPFGVQATMTSASLALQHVIDIASGTSGPSLRTRILDFDTGKKQQDRSVSRSDACPACAK